MTIADTRSRWLALIVLCLGDLMIVLDVDDRRGRAALDPRGSRVLGGVARVGRERLPADLRRLPAPGRPARRHLRPPADVSGRDRAVHARVGRLWARDLAGAPDRRAGGAGRRRSDRLGRRALAHHHAVHRARGARQGDGRLRVRRLGRRLDRCPARRHPHGHARLALDLPRQRPRRHRRLRADPRAAPGRPRQGNRAARRRGRRHGDGGLDGRRVRDRQRQPGRLDVRPDARPARRRGDAHGGLPADRVAGERPARPAQALPAAEPRDRQRRRRAVGGGDVRVVLPHCALPAARPRLQPAPGRPRVPAREPDHGLALPRASRRSS